MSIYIKWTVPKFITWLLTWSPYWTVTRVSAFRYLQWLDCMLPSFLNLGKCAKVKNRESVRPGYIVNDQITSSSPRRSLRDISQFQSSNCLTFGNIDNNFFKPNSRLLVRSKREHKQRLYWFEEFLKVFCQNIALIMIHIQFMVDNQEFTQTRTQPVQVFMGKFSKICQPWLFKVKLNVLHLAFNNFFHKGIRRKTHLQLNIFLERD